MPQPSVRNHRNNPYFFDEMLVRGQAHRRRGALAVPHRGHDPGNRYRRDMGTGQGGHHRLADGHPHHHGHRRHGRFITRRAWCVLSRHRIQKVCFETRMHTRTGRLPLVLRIHPTKVGERALIWCRAGICAADFEAHTPEIAAACYARQARVEGNRRWAQLVQLDIVRRDTLAAHTVIPPGVTRLSPKWKKAS
jgi:hypothetical protein